MKKKPKMQMQKRSNSKLPTKPVENKYKFPEPSDEQKEFYACIILHLLFPLFPIIFEFSANGYSVADTSLILTASVYAISTGVSSEDPLQFTMGIIICVSFSFLFGMISQTNSSSIFIKIVALCSIFITMFSHFIERYNKHIDGEPYCWVWSKNKQKNS
ncbi:MAG: hypothetical protein VSS75_013980 [Candidatus Parabeggiatoa sp.]|nr:hypothetical protein [Candidatus Parabeggiatoa sp.]